MLRLEFLVLVAHVILFPLGETVFDFPSFDWLLSQDNQKHRTKNLFNFGHTRKQPKDQKHEIFSNGQEEQEFDFGHKPTHTKRQELEDFNIEQLNKINSGHNLKQPKGQEVEEINFGPKPKQPKGQEVEEINFGPKPKQPKGQEVEEINFGPKPKQPKGQEIEEINFGPKPKQPKGQEVEEINFGPKPKQPKGQEIEEINFGPKPEQPKGQEVEEINFGPKPKQPKGQEIEEINFGQMPEQPKGQEVEEINFGQRPEQPRGQEVEEINFGPKPEQPKGQEVEEINFGQRPEQPRGQEVEEINFGPKPEQPKGQEVEEINFGPKPKQPKGQEIEEIHFEPKPKQPKGQEVEEINFGPKPKQPKGQEVEEINFGPKPKQPKGQEIEEINFGPKPKQPKGQEVEEIDFGPKPEQPRGQEIKEINFGPKPEQPIGQEVEEINFGPKPKQPKGQEVEEINFGPKPKQPKGQEIEEINFGPKPKQPKGQEVEEINFGPKPEQPRGQEVEEINFGPKPEQPKEQELEVFNPGQKPEEILHQNAASRAECISWEHTHYKNFDGKVLSFESNCSYILAEDTVWYTFRIITGTSNCEKACSRSLRVFYQEEEYKFNFNGKIPVLTVNRTEIPLPKQFPGLLVEITADRVLISLQTVDVTLNWNSKDLLSVTVNENMFNKTGGICGNFNNNPEDDFRTRDGFTVWDVENFLQSWEDEFDNCESTPKTKCESEDYKAMDYCEKIFTSDHFERCITAANLYEFQKACAWDVCKCGKSCACETISEFVRNCNNHLKTVGLPPMTSYWREIAGCSLDCPLGKIYSYCGPSIQKSCGSALVNDHHSQYSECIEGCFCPEGLVEFNNSCIEAERCPCKWRNKYYNIGKTIMKDCNSCKCLNGEWACTSQKCSPRCSSVGSSHYITFDGKRYDFTGRCDYYLLKSENYTVESKNMPCEEGYEIFHSRFCTKLVTIRHKTDEIIIKSNKEVSVNEVEILSLPVEVNEVVIRLASSIFVVVKLPDGVEVWWDGNTNVYIDLPENHMTATAGLCGTFNNNQKDDFKTPEGDIEETALYFARKWKSDETCTETEGPTQLHPCDGNSKYKAAAEKHCEKLFGTAFKDCRDHVDVTPFYKNCLYDVCSCQKEARHCFCPIFSDYASECARRFVELPWRNEVRECGLHCPPGQIYKPNGDSCARSCEDVSIMKGHCHNKYAEGCSCPDGLILNPTGHCVPVSDCPCFYQNIQYKPNTEILMEGHNGVQLCTCQNAMWSCRRATTLEIARDHENSPFKCNGTLHEEYTTCTPAEPKTCKNMHEQPKHSTRICFPGCVCKKGFVWDSIGKMCVNASECPCHHGGKSYADGETIQQDCNYCTCGNGMWSCTTKECPSICSAWGDSHFKTFDGRIYDFQGSCEFVLVSGHVFEYETFLITIQIVPCGSTGISCPKSITIKVKSPEKEEKAVFSKSSKHPVPGSLERILIREVGHFVFAEVFDLGITLHWDKGTRVYVKADARWKNKVKGLCGNFNDDETDDFKTPSSGGTSEISPVAFADSWRLQSYCPESSPIVETCSRRPYRKAWAVAKCSILYSDVFDRCHSEVAFEPYLERCVVDTCGCDEGGDCDCMCTAVAAYAHECTLKGVPIEWRSQEFCPLMCHENTTYSPCVATCPPKSCDNQFQHSALVRTCSDEACVEGCDGFGCPPGHVLADSSSSHCVPVTSCQTVCLTVNNVTYLEGDFMEGDDCHSCYCSHHAMVCTGKPCPEATTALPLPTSTSACPEGQFWDDCIVKCDHICNHLRHKLTIHSQCSHENECISGCRAIDLKCSHDMFLRDQHTCVHKKDCPCVSPSGSLLKPGDVVHEAECDKCQCVNNEYECVNVCTAAPTVISSSKRRHTVTPKWDFSHEANGTFITHLTVTPSVLCPNGRYGSLLDLFTRFSASSQLNESFGPAFSQMSGEGSWIAGTNNADQYLQVDLGRTETIHAIRVAGTSGNYVTAYHLLYSLNGNNFLYIISPDGQKKVFGGPLDGHDSVKRVLRTPIEARYIRFQPISWHGQISMKVDVLGCKDLVTIHPTTTRLFNCTKPIGIGQRYLPKLWITATSFIPNHNPEFVGFGNENGWRPLTNSKSEWIQIDFGNFVTVTGIKTKGIPGKIDLFLKNLEESWVERFRIEYSHDGTTWNPVLDEFGDEMVFTGNTDSDTEKVNYFKRPILAAAVKVLPVKWHNNVALRLDLMGCYESSYLEVDATPPGVTPTSTCKVCSGVIDTDICACADGEWWNGESCVNHFECPCFVGLIAYPVGSTFITEDCEECVCKLFGLSHCVPKLCQNCSNGLQKVLTPLCRCTCKPCEENTRLCPTSNVCLNESAWCNGIQDCPDDELNCTTSTTTAAPESCSPSCPPGYEVTHKKKTTGPTEAEDIHLNRKTSKSVKTYKKSQKVRKVEKNTECPPYDCVPVSEVECPQPECPLNYAVVYDRHSAMKENCPLYSCEPVRESAICIGFHKNIKSFDGTQYKYEICDHVLTTHDSGLWNITMLKNCTITSVCTTILQINHGGHSLEFRSHDQFVKVDSYPYSPNQMELLNSKRSDFSVNRIGNYLNFISYDYGFEVMYDKNGNFEIKVPSFMKRHLAGLCGLYNGHAADDKTQPDGKLSKSTVDFGKSWSNPGGHECVETVCPIEMQATATEICLKLKEKPFTLCTEHVNLELCIESTCECLISNRTTDECRCETLSDFATKCKTFEVFGWRTSHDCPPSCPPHSVYYDCYPYACQPTCGNENCNQPAVNCYSGCFCPDGLVRKGDQCIKVQECRDCVCSGNGDSTYSTFDGSLTFNGNCTYVAAREKILSEVPSFEVLFSNRLCEGSDFVTCTDGVEIKVPGHSIKIIALPDAEEPPVKVLVDGYGEDLQKEERSWSKLSFDPETSSVHVSLPREHVDVRYYYRRFAFTISLPSHYYSDRVEGLCGSCSKKVEEIEGPEKWQVEMGASCLIDPPAFCSPTEEHKGMCNFMNSSRIFGQCHAFVDPTPFFEQCLMVACSGGHICNSLEGYSQACRDAGVCVKWRSNDFCPFTCPPGLVYEACSSGCQKTCDEAPVCTNAPVEGCFCPDDQILLNGTCKPCGYCDADGHFEGDVWQVDKCTNCSCRNHVVICDKTECLGSDVVCGEDQIRITEDDVGCCPKYICECKPREECPEVETPTELQPGMEAIVNETGCCPRLKLICRKENCQEAKSCPPHYIQKIINTTNCCPDYICEKPNNICIYEYNETRSKRSPTLETVKEVGEQWSDGPCKSCICLEKNGAAEAMCFVTECPDLQHHQDYNEYELEQVPQPEQCCPEVVRKSCKHNGRVYKVGDTWIPDESNPCETMRCSDRGDGLIMMEARVEMCNVECKPGWEYKRTDERCCGQCVQIGCLFEGKVYKDGDVWFSEDKCSTSTCLRKNKQFSISTEMKSCPSVEDCPAEDVYRDGCCLKCKIRTEDQKRCFPQLLPSESTVNLIQKKWKRRGKCTNVHPIHNFTRCVGNCESFTEYKPESETHESVCSCCRPQEYSLIFVDLECESGSASKVTIAIPSKCSCTPCGK